MMDAPKPDLELSTRVATWIGDDERRVSILAAIMDEGQMQAEEALDWAQRFEEEMPDWMGGPSAEASAAGPVTTEHVRKRRET